MANCVTSKFCGFDSEAKFGSKSLVVVVLFLIFLEVEVFLSSLSEGVVFSII